MKIDRDTTSEQIQEEIQEHYIPFDMFRKVTNLDELINFIVVQSNLYSQQNGLEFQTNAKEMMVFWAYTTLWVSINYQLFKVIRDVDSLSVTRE